TDPELFRGWAGCGIAFEVIVGAIRSARGERDPAVAQRALEFAVARVAVLPRRDADELPEAVGIHLLRVLHQRDALASIDQLIAVARSDVWFRNQLRIFRLAMELSAGKPPREDPAKILYDAQRDGQPPAFQVFLQNVVAGSAPAPQLGHDFLGRF